MKEGRKVSNFFVGNIFALFILSIGYYFTVVPDASLSYILPSHFESMFFLGAIAIPLMVLGLILKKKADFVFIAILWPVYSIYYYYLIEFWFL